MTNASLLLEKLPKRVLENLAQLDVQMSSENNNGDIVRVLNQTALFGGKRFRPLLTFMVADFFQIPSQKVIPYARAIEMVHAASLAHDDVIDTATTRRGRPSLNIIATNKKAVLAGDYLLADVICSLCKLGNLKLVYELSQVIKDLSEGEWLQMDIGPREDLTFEEIEKVAKKKTASVMSWCCLAPAVLSNCADNVVEYARAFGESLGVAFQFIDDALDFSQESHSYKDSLQDLKNGIVNSVMYEVLKQRPLEGKKFYEESSQKELDDLQEPFWSPEELQQAIARTRAKAQIRLTRARDLLYLIRKEHRFSNEKLAEESFQSLEAILDFLLLRQS